MFGKYRKYRVSVNRKYRVSYTISENTYKSVSYRIFPSYLKDPTARSGILK